MFKNKSTDGKNNICGLKIESGQRFATDIEKKL